MRTMWSTRRRRSQLLSLAGITAVIAGAAPTGVLAAAAKTTGFVAETTSGFVALQLSHDGRQITRAFIAYTQKCSDGTSFTDWDAFKSIPVSASRKFTANFDTGPQMSTSVPGASAEFAGAITGTVNKKRTSIVGTVHYALAIKKPDGSTSTCDTGTFNYVAKD